MPILLTSIKKILFITLFALLTMSGSYCEAKEVLNVKEQEAKNQQSVIIDGELLELVETAVLNGKVTLLVPENFEPMGEDMKIIKYPNADRPQLVLTTPDGTVDIAFNHTNNEISNENMAELTTEVIALFKKVFPSAQWLNEEMLVRNDKNIGVVEIIVPIDDMKIYNKFIFIELEGRFLVIAFNYPETEMAKWKPVFEKIFDSIVIYK